MPGLALQPRRHRISCPQSRDHDPRLMTRNRFLFAVSLAIALAPRPAHPQAGMGGEWRLDVERFAQSLVDAQLLPGMGIAVTQGDRVVYSKAFGLADAASGRHANEDGLLHRLEHQGDHGNRGTGARRTQAARLGCLGRTLKHHSGWLSGFRR